MSKSTAFKRGFTLVELLVVIVIIAALAAVTFSVASRMKKAANTAATVANMRQVGTALITHTAENRTFPDRTGGERWDKSIISAFGYTEDLPATPTSENAPQLAHIAEIFGSPLDKVERAGDGYKCSYTLPGWTCNANGGRFRFLPADKGVPLTQVDHPERACLLLQKFTDNNFLAQGTNGYAAMGTFPADVSDTQIVVFLDGHVETLTMNMSVNVFKEKYWPLKRN